MNTPNSVQNKLTSLVIVANDKIEGEKCSKLLLDYIRVCLRSFLAFHSVRVWAHARSFLLAQRIGNVFINAVVFVFCFLHKLDS